MKHKLSLNTPYRHSYHCNLAARQLLRKFTIFFLILNLIFVSFPFNVFAQTATSSAELVGQTASISAPNSTEQILQQLPDLFASQDKNIASPSPSFPNTENKFSASIKSSSIIRNLAKRGFRSNEKVTVTVDNVENQSIQTSVFDLEGNEVDIEIFTIDNGIQKTVVVKPPPHLRPGKYTIEIKTADGQIYKQDFTWGVLAINTNKSIYLPKETAKLAMAVLDEFGNMVCDTNVKLEIRNPKSETTILSTDNGLIKVNPQCQSKEITTIPDYESSYIVEGTGVYNMNLSSVTKNGSYSITDSFEVRDSVPFDVERITATRIYPPNSYPVNLVITANEDFNGTIVELVPGSFAIEQSLNSDYSYKEIKTLLPSAMEANILGASGAAELGLPFKEAFPVNLEFGQPLRDKFQRNLYARFNLAGHDGVDFDLPYGTLVFSVDDGEVVLAGKGAYGTTVVIQHSWGKSYYGHLSKTELTVGRNVAKGEEIALSGNTGLSTGPHLHFGIKPNNPDMQNGYYGKIDPLPLLGIESQLDPANQIKFIAWDISLKKGQKINLSYSFRAPNISPELYKLGPLSFYEGTGSVFKEARQWQIAADAISFQEVQTGTVESATATVSSVTTSTSLTAVTNDLYLAAISTKLNSVDEVIDNVTGLGLTWTLVGSLCSARSQIKTAIFKALGTPTGDGTVTANFTGTGIPAIGGAAIAVARYTGVDTTSPIGNTTTFNTLGTNGACTGGTDTSSYSSTALSTSQANSVVFSAAGERNRTHTAGTGGTGYTERADIKSGTGGNSAGIAIQDQTFASTTTNLTVDGTFNGVVDWSVIAIEIKLASAVSTPTLDQLMRHGKWFNAGVEQPFTF